MSSLKEKERVKEQQDKFQAILSALLKDEDNKYCVDCDAKGPRWASWNLGIFLCIRCAGIHRNLGVHISKVKSVNLDTWTPEQIAMVQEIGNSRARAVYEANIPDGFRRPQTDSALEAFIRSKYESKKYIAREWIPPQPKIPKEWLEDSRAEKKRARANKQATGVQLPSIPKVNEKRSNTEPAKPAAVAASKPEPVKAQPAPSSATNDLLGLDLGTAQPTNPQQTMAPVKSHSNELLDMFGGPQAAQNQPPPQPPSADLMPNGSSADSTNLFGADAQTAQAGEDKKSAKDSIMALFGGSGGGMAQQPQMYGVPATDSNPFPAAPAAAQNGSDDLIKMHNGSSTTAANAQKFIQGMQPTIDYPQQATGFAQQPQQQQQAAMMANNPFMPGYPVPYSEPYQQPATVTSMGSVLQQENFMEHLGISARPGKTFTATGQSKMPQWNYNKPGFYGNQGGVYMAQGQQQMYPNQGMMAQPQQGMLAQPQQAMMGQQQAMVGQPQQNVMGQSHQNLMGQSQQNLMGQPQQNLMGQQQGMMGQQQSMIGQPQQGMMGQGMQPGMMGNPQGMMGQGMMAQQTPVNGAQTGMFAGQNQMMGANTNVYNPQQMQQLQFQQMQQQMASMKLSGAQMPQQAVPGAPANSWGAPASGHTLANNLWQ